MANEQRTTSVFILATLLVYKTWASQDHLMHDFQSKEIIDRKNQTIPGIINSLLTVPEHFLAFLFLSSVAQPAVYIFNLTIGYCCFCTH